MGDQLRPGLAKGQPTPRVPALVHILGPMVERLLLRNPPETHFGHGE